MLVVSKDAVREDCDQSQGRSPVLGEFESPFEIEVDLIVIVN